MGSVWWRGCGSIGSPGGALRFVGRLWRNRGGGGGLKLSGCCGALRGGREGVLSFLGSLWGTGAMLKFMEVVRGTEVALMFLGALDGGRSGCSKASQGDLGQA